MTASFRHLALWMTMTGLSLASSPTNILLICIDDLRPELGCYGKDYIQSPNIDRLAAQGRRFSRHYVQAPSCGPSRFALLTGRYGPPKQGNDALFKRAKQIKSANPSLPAWFREQGYTTVSVGKVSHHPGGWGGADWNQREVLEMPEAWTGQFMPCGPWRHPRGAMHGLANGETRGPEKHTMAVFQSHDGPSTSYPDGLIADKGLTELRRLSGESRPFFLAVGLIRPHLPFGAPARYLDPYLELELPEVRQPEKPERRTTWSGSGEFRQYDLFDKDPWSDPAFAMEVRKHYAACVSYADALVGRLLDELDRLGRSDDTIVVLWGDHGFHLGEHAVWGKHTLFEESLHSPLIIRSPRIPKPGEPSTRVVETVDIFPTLCELADLPQPRGLSGQSLIDTIDGKLHHNDSALSQWQGNRTLRTNRYRLIVHRDGFTELYDHHSTDKETVNLAASNPELVESLKQRLEAKTR